MMEKKTDKKIRELWVDMTMNESVSSIGSLSLWSSDDDSSCDGYTGDDIYEDKFRGLPQYSRSFTTPPPKGQLQSRSFCETGRRMGRSKGLGLLPENCERPFLNDRWASSSTLGISNGEKYSTRDMQSRSSSADLKLNMRKQLGMGSSSAMTRSKQVHRDMMKERQKVSRTSSADSCRVSERSMAGNLEAIAPKKLSRWESTSSFSSRWENGSSVGVVTTGIGAGHRHLSTTTIRKPARRGSAGTLDLDEDAPPATNEVWVSQKYDSPPAVAKRSATKEISDLRGLAQIQRCEDDKPTRHGKSLFEDVINQGTLSRLALRRSDMHSQDAVPQRHQRKKSLFEDFTTEAMSVLASGQYDGQSTCKSLCNTAA